VTASRSIRFNEHQEADCNSFNKEQIESARFKTFQELLASVFEPEGRGAISPSNKFG
jgi:hypothetical protein